MLYCTEGTDPNVPFRQSLINCCLFYQQRATNSGKRKFGERVKIETSYLSLFLNLNTVNTTVTELYSNLCGATVYSIHV